jgi:hypothetical protein
LGNPRVRSTQSGQTKRTTPAKVHYQKTQGEIEMPYSEVTGRYSQIDSDEFPRSISWQQLFVLHVAANYQLRCGSAGWWADGHVWADGVYRIHSPATVKSLLKKGLLEGNARGATLARRAGFNSATKIPVRSHLDALLIEARKLMAAGSTPACTRHVCKCGTGPLFS